jgi:hypothetical protein
MQNIGRVLKISRYDILFACRGPKRPLACSFLRLSLTRVLLELQRIQRLGKNGDVENIEIISQSDPGLWGASLACMETPPRRLDPKA